MDVIETTLQCTRKTVSSALMTMTCLSATVAPLEQIQGIEIEKPSPQSSNEEDFASSNSPNNDQEVQELKEAIAALQEQLKLYKARALYAHREADRLLTIDWVSYRRYISEARRYDQMSKDTEKKIEELNALLK